MTDEKRNEQDFDKKQITEQELVKYEKNFSESGLKAKLQKYAKVIGVGAIYKIMQLWYVLQKPEVPMAQKMLITGALGYLIAPLDFIPDLTPILGYSDDFVAITYALVQVQGYVDPEVKDKSKHFIEDVFGKDAISELD